MLTINLQGVQDIDLREYESGDKYVRVTFFGKDQNGVDQTYKVSVSKEQWNQLRAVMGIVRDGEYFKVNSPLTLQCLEGAQTTGKTPKPYVERKIGTFKGYSFDYMSLHVGLFIANGVVAKQEFVKDLGDLFD